MSKKSKKSGKSGKGKWAAGIAAVLILAGLGSGNEKNDAPKATEPVQIAAETTETTVPETTALETVAPETTAQETTAPETTVPEPPVSETTVPTTTETVTEATQYNGFISDYVVNISSGKIHKANRSCTNTIKESNRREYHCTVEELEAMGYEKCGRCW